MTISFLHGPLDGTIQGVTEFPEKGAVAICEARDARYEHVYDWSTRELCFIHHSVRKKSLTHKKVALNMRIKVRGEKGEYHPHGYLYAEAV